MSEAAQVPAGGAATVIEYHVTALQMTIYFNREGDHDHNGLIYTLTRNAPILKYIRALAAVGRPGSQPPTEDMRCEAEKRACELGVVLPTTPAQARQPHPLVRPLVLRARLHETVKVILRNEIRDEEGNPRPVGIHLVSDGYDVITSDGSKVGNNPSSLVPREHNQAQGGLASDHESEVYVWACRHEGVFPFHDGGNYSGGEDGTNVHGLFGALIVEPPGTTWRDPVTGRASHGDTGSGPFEELDGLYVDVLPPGQEANPHLPSDTCLENHVWEPPQPDFCFGETAHREFVVFFHDEPEFVPPHTHLEPNPCHPETSHGNGADGMRAAQMHAGGAHRGHNRGDHGGHGDLLPIMPISYRAEPMVNRERTLWRLLRTGHEFERPVLNEEQHHSSWMFGDPVTPILKAYIGDPVRIRLVHGGVKETHVFHLHLYEWYAVAGDTTSPRIDAISISPQTAHTIEPVWGAGNRHQVAGDVIWHCHLYPHFHEGMWGIFRTFETRQDGVDGEELCAGEECQEHCAGEEGEKHCAGHEGEKRCSDKEGEKPCAGHEGEKPCAGSIYAGRRIGRYPDGTRIEKLLPLPLKGRKPPPKPTPERPGFPLYIPGRVRQKSPIPPWPDREFHDDERCEELGPAPNIVSLLAADMPADFDYRPTPTQLERNAFNEMPVPGELFTRNPIKKQQAAIYNYKKPEDSKDNSEDQNHDDCQSEDDYNHKERERDRFKRNATREVFHDVVVAMQEIVYNSDGWHDKHGHLYYLEGEGEPASRAGPIEPLFFRANHGQIVNVVLRNALEERIDETEFDHAFPPCPALAWEGECATHVHMVKFDPICADGASVGWNYMSGARFGRKMVYRWWADQEFGTIFFHDHLFANYRQKHGLFGALLVEPAGSTYRHPVDGSLILTGLQAVIERHKDDPDRGRWFREFCMGVGDFIPMWDRRDRPLNPPPEPGGHGDQGVMAINYRSAPLRERRGDPAYWFSSRVHGDPDTTVFTTYANDPVWMRLVQGSHEEQHSFQTHGLRWNRFRANTDSAIRNQQTIGIAEAFTFVNRSEYGPGDYLYKLSGADDLWLGCWGLIRALEPPEEDRPYELFPHAREDRLRSAADRPQDGAQAPDTHGNAHQPERCFHVVVEQQTIIYRDSEQRDPFGVAYRDHDLQDPFGLVYRLCKVTGDDVDETEIYPGRAYEPLVLWCREGEQVKVVLENRLRRGIELRPEPHAPEVPVEKRDRRVSSQVSMHADLVAYDVRSSDGANVGLNPVQTIPPGGTRTYWWDTSRPNCAETRLEPVLLQDMADVRNHRHHGLIGALVILPEHATPYAVEPGEPTAADHAKPTWHGARVTVRHASDAGDGAGPSAHAQSATTEHMVALLQDGLRLFLNGNTKFPLPDPPEEEAGEAEHEDQGQKGINYRSEPIGIFDPRGSGYTLDRDPATPIWVVHTGAQVRFHLIGALDKPRNYSFTIHGVSWPEHRFMQGEVKLIVSSESGLTCGSTRTFEFAPEYEGDHAYRSGVLKWAVPQGMWGILRVQSPDANTEEELAAREGTEGATVPADPAPS